MNKKSKKMSGKLLISKENLKSLIKERGVFDVEREIIKWFIEENQLSIKKNKLIENYFDNYSSNPEIRKFINDDKKFNLIDLANFLELLIPQEDKKINGAFFTPSYIVDFIIDEIKPKENDTNLDPSCGTGTFLICLAEYYLREFNKPIPKTIKENIFGVDLLPYNIRRAKVLLSLLGLLNNQNVVDSDFNLVEADSLKVDWSNIFKNRNVLRFDNILGNPPYVKFQDLSDDARKFIKEKYSTTQNGNFNIYFAFFELSYSLMKSTSKLGFITPNNYFTSLAGKSLREFFHEKKCVEKVIDFNHKKVFDAQTYTAITFITKNVKDSILYDRIGENQKPLDFLANLDTSEVEISTLSTSKWRLLKSSEQENIYKIENTGLPLGEIVDIRVGIATLKDNVYFVDGSNESRKYYLKDFEGKEYKIEKEITRDIYKISELKEQNDVEANNKKIIFPYIVGSGQVKLMTEEYVKKTYPETYKYLLAVKEILNSRDKGKIKLEEWFGFGRTQGLGKSGKKILTPTFSQYPRFLFVENQESLFCNGYGIFSKSQEKLSLFDDLNDSVGDETNFDILQKILNSKIMDYYVKKTSVSIEGGYPCYQKNFIERFTVPDLNEDEINFLRNMNDFNQIDDFLIDKYQLEGIS